MDALLLVLVVGAVLIALTINVGALVAWCARAMAMIKPLPRRDRRRSSAAVFQDAARRRAAGFSMALRRIRPLARVRTVLATAHSASGLPHILVSVPATWKVVNCGSFLSIHGPAGNLYAIRRPDAGGDGRAWRKICALHLRRERTENHQHKNNVDAKHQLYDRLQRGPTRI